mmetsp:Transcript_28061/g.93197  ORF Transcript_28061/g.93197 Transcript_28061/m.93197 type:complete len:106 (+) Transcript_28061:478-795(+)
MPRYSSIKDCEVADWNVSYDNIVNQYQLRGESLEGFGDQLFQEEGGGAGAPAVPPALPPPAEEPVPVLPALPPPAEEPVPPPPAVVNGARGRGRGHRGRGRCGEQ